MILNLGEWPRRAVLRYSGTYTTKTITVNGKSYTLYSFTGSGTLSVSGGKLKNASFVEKAPAAVVEAERAKLAKAEAVRENVIEALKAYN